MIIGIGNDLIDISRVERVLDRFGDRFVRRGYTNVERAKSERRANRVESYVKRIVAKEACSKALGTGIRMGVFWRDMAVTNLNSGKPTLLLTGGAAKRLDEITPKGMIPQIDISMTDEPPLAQALVIISALPKNSENEV